MPKGGTFMFKKIAMSLAAMGVAAGAYLLFIRPWQLRWGATDEEVARAMSGDEFVKTPTFNATRGVTINAPPEEIFPWLVQMGVTRAGWYSYDLLDNLGKPSARRRPAYKYLSTPEQQDTLSLDRTSQVSGAHRREIKATP